ncbi:MAG: NTP transferase domain-containing protein [Planctomycetales bacterium]|nr:NTP transferase domain-containing protein [Planctomycetales bacterium]
MSGFRSFAIVPAAGRCRRMGASKLLLPMRGATLIDAVLRAWIESAVTQTVVVVRAADVALAERCRRHDVHVVAVDAEPREMRDSLEIGLQYAARRFAPQVDDAWLVAPADLPGLNAKSINAVLARYEPAAPRVVIPLGDGRPGHPVLLPWSEAAAFRSMRGAGGLDCFLRDRPAGKTDAFEPVDGVVRGDLDTPDDLRRWTSDATG